MRAGVDIDRCEYLLACGKFRRRDPGGGSVPRERLYGGRQAWGHVDRHAAVVANGVQVAAGDGLIAHEAADVGDALAVSGPARCCDLQRWLQQCAHDAAVRFHEVELSDPPVVIAGAVGRAHDELTAIRRPVVFIDIQVRRTQHLRRAALRWNHGQALLIDRRGEIPGITAERIERAGKLGCARGIQKGNAPTVGREARGVQWTLRLGQRAHVRAGRIRDRDLRLLLHIRRHEHDSRPVGRPRGTVLIADRTGTGCQPHRCGSVAGVDQPQHRDVHVGRTALAGRHRAIHQMRAIGRQGHFSEGMHGAESVQNRRHTRWLRGPGYGRPADAGSRQAGQGNDQASSHDAPWTEHAGLIPMLLSQ